MPIDNIYCHVAKYVYETRNVPLAQKQKANHFRYRNWCGPIYDHADHSWREIAPDGDIGAYPQRHGRQSQCEGLLSGEGSMSAFPFREDDLAIQAEAFAQSITPAKARWQYCFEKSTYWYTDKYGRRELSPNVRTHAVCDRILGVYKGSSAYPLRQIRLKGIDAAFEWAGTLKRYSARPMFYVGPMQSWHVGHVYFARVRSHPHVVKIGFSRRVRDRVNDIETKCRSQLFVQPKQLLVGTLADEHWWHKNWSKHRISGEWFLDPFMSDRTLPSFLDQQQNSEAA